MRAAARAVSRPLGDLSMVWGDGRGRLLGAVAFVLDVAAWLLWAKLGRGAPARQGWHW